MTLAELRGLYRTLQIALAGLEHGEEGRFVIHRITDDAGPAHEDGLTCWCCPTVLVYPEDFRDLNATMRRIRQEWRPH